MWKKKHDGAFHLDLFFMTYVFSSSSKKPGATHTSTEQGDPLTALHTWPRTWYARIIARNSQQTQSTRNTTQPCTYHRKKQPTNTEHTQHNTADKLHRAHVTDPNNVQPPRHGVIKRSIGGSLARSWPPPLPRPRRYYVLVLLLLGLSAAANNRCDVLASAVCEFRLLCVCVLAYVWSFLA